MLNWSGAWAAIATPFKGGKIDVDALQTYVNFLIEQQIDGIVAAGTTGESPCLDLKDREILYKACKEVIAGRVPLVAGVGTNNTVNTVEYAKQAESLGVDGLLVVTPYYNKPNQHSLYGHHSEVARAVDLPQILYNVPGRTACNLLPHTVARLAHDHANIVGIKDATGDMLVASRIKGQVSDDFLLFSGDDATTLPFMLLGGVGCISVVANVAPKLMHDLCQAAAVGEVMAARAYHHRMLPLFDMLFSDTSPIPLKAILSSMDLGVGNALRPPLYAMVGEEYDALVGKAKKWLKG